MERTIADLVEQWTDLSLVAGVVRDAVLAGRLLAPDRLATYLEPIARTRRRDIGNGDGRSLAEDLFKVAGTTPEGFGGLSQVEAAQESSYAYTTRRGPWWI